MTVSPVQRANQIADAIESYYDKMLNTGVITDKFTSYMIENAEEIMNFLRTWEISNRFE